MTTQEVADRVDAIIGTGDADPEAMHYDEDRLVLDVLHAIISDPSNAAELAGELIRTVGREDVVRWYA